MILFVSINFDDLKRNSHELKKKRNNDLKLTPLLPRQQFVFPLLTPPLPRALNKLTNISASSQPKRLGPFFSGWHHPTRRDDFPFWKMHDPSLPQPPSPPQSKPSSLVAGYFWIMDTVVASVCPRNNRVLIPTRSCPPRNTTRTCSCRPLIGDVSVNRLAIRGWRTIRPLSRHGQHVEMVIGGDGASDECLMRRSDTILTASYVDDAMFCTDDSYPRFCRIEARSRSSFGKIFEFYCY